MHTPWLRAFRPVALNRNPALPTRPSRSFRTSVAARAPNDNNNAPRDDGKKPDKGDGNDEGNEDGDSKSNANVDENIFGDNPTTTNGESQGRKKPSNGLRSRTLRNRKPEELPPVQVPKSFLATAITRLEDIRAQAKPEIDGRNEDAVRDTARQFFSENLSSRAVHKKMHTAAAWWDIPLEEAIKSLSSNQDLAPIWRRGDVIVASLFWSFYDISPQHGKDFAAKMLESESFPSFDDFALALVYTKQIGRSLTHTQRMVNVVVRGEYPVNYPWLCHPSLLGEVVASIRTDLMVQAPKNVKLGDLQRPVTILNGQDYSGVTVPSLVVRHAADKLGADVLHLTASDIAHVAGIYLGQDAARAPGAISQLGYKAALNSGRLKPPHASEDDNDDSDMSYTPYSVVIRDERLRKENKRSISLMDDFLNGSNRGKSDELWEDIKVNTALEELVHSADSDSTEQRPLIVHVDDFNALNMDLECGAMIMGKIRKVIDGLWLEGRKVALVGSCSSKGAPKTYLAALRELESKERVINLSRLLSCPTEIQDERLEWEKRDYLDENDANIVKVLTSMVEPNPEDTAATTGILGLSKAYTGIIPETWSSSVLPLTEVYRIATAMIAYSEDSAGIFTLASLKKAASTMVEVDLVKEMANKEMSEDKDKRKSSKGGLLAEMQKLDPRSENHEERLMSGLVKAQDIRTTFGDVHAPQETIESVKMLTTLSLVRPEAFTYGVLATDRIPGCLLYGPPGTGKTLLAKAVARESGANMIEVSGASINAMYVGESEKNVRALFRLAKKKEPMVIFIDEADALLGARGGRQNGARRETINQFLREWDGMDKMKAFIMVATNRPFDLDEAVLRRLPRKLLIDLPLEPDRAAILRIHLKDEILDDTVSIEHIAKHTPLYSGSDLKHVCVAAAMAAVKEELEASERHQGPEPYVWPAERRVLGRRHFDKGLKEIGASVSEDMATLAAIKKFDEKYGDGKARGKRKGMGFEVVPDAVDSEGARVRNGR